MRVQRMFLSVVLLRHRRRWQTQFQSALGRHHFFAARMSWSDCPLTNSITRKGIVPRPRRSQSTAIMVLMAYGLRASASCETRVTKHGIVADKVAAGSFEWREMF